MTDLAIFVDAPFGDRDAFNDFLFANAQSHQQIAAKFAAQGKVIDALPMVEMGNEKDWLLVHEARHQQELEQLGIAEPVSLGEVDLSDESAFNDWMLTHADIHLFMNQALGLV